MRLAVGKAIGRGKISDRLMGPYALFAVCLISRLAFFGVYIDDWDSVNFAFALSKGYDVFVDQPHFHGYPVYIFAGRIIYEIWRSDVGALTLAGIIFNSLAIFPFYALVARMFTSRVAKFAAVLYIINPLIWVEAEKPLSDGFGLFFVAAFSYFLYRAIERDNNCDGSGEARNSSRALTWLFLGGLTLGLGIGVRISYMAFIATWGYAVFLSAKQFSVKRAVVSGFGGLGLGVLIWFGYVVGKFGLVEYFVKFAKHSKYHFVDESYSIMASNDFAGRMLTIFKNITAYSLGSWWPDTPMIRLLPTAVMAIAIAAYIIHEKMDIKNRFMAISIGSYIVWLIVVQYAVRHTMALSLFFIILISAGFFIFIDWRKGRGRGRIALPVMLFLILAPMLFDSGRLAWLNKYVKPPQVAVVDYVAKNYDKETTLFFCLNTWRFFQYYAPEWYDKQNSHVYFTPRVSVAEEKLKNKTVKPKTVLISSTLFERDRYKDRLRKVVSFKRDKYSVAEYNWLALYEFDMD